MKNCIKCTSPLNDDARFCPICGTEQIVEKKVNNNFCTACGLPITSNTNFCPQCGNPIKSNETQQMFEKEIPPLIKSLSNRITLSAVIWLIISIFQLTCGVLLLCIASLTFNWSGDYIIAIIIYLALGGLNMREAVHLFKYEKTILTDYVGIVYTNRICVATCANYGWNAFVVLNGLLAGNGFSLLFAMLTIAAIIVDFTSIQLFVKNNRDSFIQLEKSQLPEEKVESSSSGEQEESYSAEHSNQIVMNMLAGQEMPVLDKDNPWYNLYSTYSLQQLEGILAGAASYEPEAVYMAKALYMRRINNIEC